MHPIVRPFTGSIVDTALGAHAIVNSSNPELGLGSGVSGAIQDACGGLPFQRLVRDVWEDEFDAPLEPSDCLVTRAGKASAFSWVLHVPSVNYRRRDTETGGSTGPSRVRDCFTAALREASLLAAEHNLEGEFVLGTPLLGAGHGGLGAIRALEAMMGALREWREREPWLLRQVVVAVIDGRDARLISLAAQRFRLV